MVDAERARRWAAILAHRERLLRLCRARLGNEQDAEDCVQEAMLRCVEFAGLDEARLGQFLTSVTLRLCADHYRASARRDRLSRRLTGRRHEVPSPEDDACDRAEAIWVAARLRTLPARQREVVVARAAGMSAAEAARRLDVSVASVNSALERARRSIRDTLTERWSGLVVATGPGGAGWSGLWRRLTGGGTVTATAAIVTAGLLFPHAAVPGFGRDAVPAGPPAVVLFRDREAGAGTAVVAAAPAAPVATRPAPPGARPSPRPRPGGPRDDHDRPPPIVDTPYGSVGQDDDTEPTDVEHHVKRVHECVKYGVQLSPSIKCRSEPPDPPPSD